MCFYRPRVKFRRAESLTFPDTAASKDGFPLPRGYRAEEGLRPSKAIVFYPAAGPVVAAAAVWGTLNLTPVDLRSDQSTFYF